MSGPAGAPDGTRALRVRRARPEDREAWVHVYTTVAAERRWIGREPPVDVEAFGELFAGSVVSDEHVLMVVVDHDDVAMGTGGLHPGSAGGVWGLGMCLLPEARGRGGGGRLLDALLVAAAEPGDRHKVELSVWPHNGRAVALYAGRGFAVEGLLRAHHRRADGSLWDILQMGLALPR